MPYRRLPNTDAARLRAMKVAKAKFDEIGSASAPFSTKTMIEINTFIPQFERAIAEYKMSVSMQSEKSI